ncbi:MAG: YigZ family protein [Lachnospiraceae bacterium]|nr:YigZ family protein [Lachnospiraceae bacterium]
MSNKYHVLLNESTGEFEDKKSRFLARMVPVTSEEEAYMILEQERKKYYDAKHHCSAFILTADPGKPAVMRASDDGEPQGTAGRPMLEVLQGADLQGVVVVVTRYFGGTLLGTGGLIRAYTAAAQDALRNAKLGVMTYGATFTLTTDYNSIGKIQYQLASRGLEPIASEYGAEVSMTLQVEEEEIDTIRALLVEITNGQVKLSDNSFDYFVQVSC